MKQWRITAAAVGGMAIFILTWLALGGGAAVAAPIHPAMPAVTITQTLVLSPAKDNTLYQSELGTLSNGAGQFLFAGNTDSDAIRRGLLAFDLSGIPAGATVLSATLTLTMSKSIAGETPVALHALAADWGEGAADAAGEEGFGATAGPGDATWLHTFHDTALWAQPGGDFAAAPSAVTPVGGPGIYAWSSPALVADVAAWLADPAVNFGWALLGDETTNRTAKRFDSRENEPANRPRLAITYTVATEQAFVPVIVR
jgi:hypothetical protein